MAVSAMRLLLAFLTLTAAAQSIRDYPVKPVPFTAVHFRHAFYVVERDRFNQVAFRAVTTPSTSLSNSAGLSGSSGGGPRPGVVSGGAVPVLRHE